MMIPQFELITQERASRTYRIDEYYFDGATLKPQLIFLHRGDLLVEGDLDFNWFLERAYTNLEEYYGAKTVLLIVDGDLIVTGEIASLYDPVIYVAGEIVTNDSYEDLWEDSLVVEIKKREKKDDVYCLVQSLDKKTFTYFNFEKEINSLSAEQKEEFIKLTVKANLYGLDCQDGMTMCAYMLLYWIDKEFSGSKKQKLKTGKMVSEKYKLGAKAYHENESIAPEIKGNLLKSIQKYF